MWRRDKSLDPAGNWTKIPRLSEPQPPVLIFTKLSWRSNTNQVQQLHISEEVDLHIVIHNSVYVIPYFFLNTIVLDSLYILADVHISNGDVTRNDTAIYNCQLQKINITKPISYLKTAKYTENPWKIILKIAYWFSYIYVKQDAKTLI